MVNLHYHQESPRSGAPQAAGEMVIDVGMGSGAKLALASPGFAFDHDIFSVRSLRSGVFCSLGKPLLVGFERLQKDFEKGPHPSNSCSLPDLAYLFNVCPFGFPQFALSSSNSFSCRKGRSQSLRRFLGLWGLVPLRNPSTGSKSQLTRVSQSNFSFGVEIRDSES